MKTTGGENGLNKIALVCLFTLIVGSTPVFAANSNNTYHETQIQKYSHIQLQNSTKILNESIKELHSLFIQNNHLKEDIKEMCSNMSKERIITDPREEIQESVEKETRVQILNSMNQLNSNSSRIRSLIRKNDALKKEIQKFKEINETKTIISTEIHTNKNEIKSLIRKNEDLINAIDPNP